MSKEQTDRVRNAPAPDQPKPRQHVDRTENDEDVTGGLPGGGGVADRDGDGKVKSEPRDAPEGSPSDLIDAEQDREQKGANTPTETPAQDHTRDI